MWVKEIVIDGFKSYAKRTVVTDWDTQFNCITGLNGSGKSNILDAICFVLGITSMATVRAQNQQDLIYKRGQAGVTKASVSIVFDNTAKDKSPLDYKEVDTITVTRQVVLGGTSKYLVNGHRAQQAQVQQLFQEVQLNVNNPNFLIMQGQITKVVNMRPKEILGLIEEAAGTGMYEKERQRAVREIRDRDAPLHETESLLVEEVRPKLEKLRAQKRDFLEYQQVAASTEATERTVAASEWFHASQRLAHLDEEASTRERTLDELRAALAADTARSSELDDRARVLRSQSGPDREVDRLDAELQRVTEEQARTTTLLEHKQQVAGEIDAKLTSSKTACEQIQAELHAFEQNSGAFQSEHAVLRTRLEHQRARVVQQRELVSSLQTGISTTGERETGFALATKRAREAVVDAEQQLKALQTELTQLEAHTSDEAKRATLEMHAAQIRDRLVELQANESAKQTELSRQAAAAESSQELRAQQLERRDDATRALRDLERLLAKHPNLDIPLRAHFSPQQVRGRVAHLVQIRKEHEDKVVALETTAGFSLWDLVVDNEHTAAAVLKAARQRTTCLPLSRIRPRVIPADVVSQIGGNCWRAVDLLDFNPDVRPAIENVFGRTIICASSTEAERAAFTFKVRSVTLDGDIYDPRGVLSGGFVKSSPGGVFKTITEYHRLVAAKAAADEALAEGEAALDNVDAAATAASQLENELTLIAHELSLEQSRLDEAEAAVQDDAASYTRLEALQSTLLPNARKAHEEATTALSTCLADAQEFASDREGKLQKLQQELDAAILEEEKISSALDERQAEHTRVQSELTRLRTELEQENDSAAQATLALQDIRTEIQSGTENVRNMNRQITELNTKLSRERQRVSSAIAELSGVEQELEQTQQKLADTRLELQQQSHNHEKHSEIVASARAKLQEIERQYPWAAELAQSGNVELRSGPDLAELRHNLQQQQRRLSSLASRVDASVVSMIERLEADETQLRQRLATIREDRRKLEESMETLNERRRTTIDRVWRQVSTDFGLIFGDLLPESSCELDPLENNPIDHGFALKVRLGTTWKDGLNELSGGQRSLVALSLILALLRYHPAPMYILDEVDAALDVHHTRNIGHIIKTRFKNSQFIVVSLKDDMFTNANRIFQTKFIEGTSTVAIMV